jgi:hypothetical protein
MARELFDREQFGPQRRLAREWTRMRLPGDPGYWFQSSVKVHYRQEESYGVLFPDDHCMTPARVFHSFGPVG